MGGQVIKRLKILRKFRAWKRHRYEIYRAATMAISVAILYVVPLSHLALFDAWGGNHYALGKPVGPVEGFGAVFGGIAILYIVTFAMNSFVGRMFCGFGCPVAQISRFGEAVDLSGRTGKGRLASIVKGGLFGIAVSLGMLLWWVDVRVFWQGSPQAIGIVLGVLAVLALLTFVHSRYWRWEFCMQVCPIGLYYSMVAPEKTHGIVFDNDQLTCKDCNVCEVVCPVHLDPRRLWSLRRDIGGLAMNDLPADNHCLRCGDCVAGCEYVFRNEPESKIPLLFATGVKGRPADGAGRPVDTTGAAS